jgi:hypothetical protein
MRIGIPTIRCESNLVPLLKELDHQLKSLTGRPKFFSLDILIVQNIVDKSANVSPEFNTALSIRSVIEPRIGFSSVRNCLLRESQDVDWLVMIDDDLTLDKNFLSEVIKQLEESSELALLGGNVRQVYSDVYLNNFEIYQEGGRNSKKSQEFGAGIFIINIKYFLLHRLNFNPIYDIFGGEDLDIILKIRELGGETKSCKNVNAQEYKTSMSVMDYLHREKIRAQGSVIVRLHHGLYLSQIIQLAYHGLQLAVYPFQIMLKHRTESSGLFLVKYLKALSILQGEMRGFRYGLISRSRSKGLTS